MSPGGSDDRPPSAGDIDPWVFGEQPLPQSLELAPLLRRVIGLALSLEEPAPAMDRLIADLRRAETELAGLGPTDPTPRLGPNPRAGQRIYIDHGRDIGAFNPVFPEYDIVVEGPQATGTVMFPLAFEGPPGLVWGGMVASFFDGVIQHHHCELGQTGKTTSLEVRYRRPTPIGVELRFEISREQAGSRLVSIAHLLRDDELLVTATMAAVAGERDKLPVVSPRRWVP